MKGRTWFLPVAAMVTAACSPSLSSFDAGVGALIAKQCQFDSPCTIRVRDATDFDWDEMYVLRPGILDAEARRFLPEVGELRGEFNRKIVFLKNGRRVNADEAPSIIEGEHTPPGMLFFDQEIEGNPDCLRYTSNVEFAVTKEKWSRGNVYQLRCSNCSESPVFFQFGTASQIRE